MAVLVLLWLASESISGGNMTPGELVSFFLYAAVLTRPVSALASVYGQTQQARGAMERLQSVLTESLSRSCMLAEPCRRCTEKSRSTASVSPIPAVPPRCRT